MTQGILFGFLEDLGFPAREFVATTPRRLTPIQTYILLNEQHANIEFEGYLELHEILVGDASKGTSCLNDPAKGVVTPTNCSGDVLYNPQLINLIVEISKAFPYLSGYYVCDVKDHVVPDHLLRPNRLGEMGFNDYENPTALYIYLITQYEEFSSRVMQNASSIKNLFAQVSIDNITDQLVLENIDFVMALVVLHEYGHLAHVIYKKDYRGVDDIKACRSILVEADYDIKSVIDDDTIRILYADKRERFGIAKEMYSQEHPQIQPTEQEINEFMNERVAYALNAYRNLTAELFATKFVSFAITQIPHLKARFDEIKSQTM